MVTILLLLKSIFFKKGLDNTSKFNFNIIIYLAIGGIVLFLYLTNSSKNEEIANLNSQIELLTTDNKTLKSNLTDCNSKVDKQNAAALAVSGMVEQLDDNLREADAKKRELEKEIEKLTKTKAPKDCDGATNWLVDRAEELKKWQK